METAATIAITREAARLAFLCSQGIGAAEDFGTAEDFDLRLAMDSHTSFEQEKAELLAGIREEVCRHAWTRRSELHEGDLNPGDLKKGDLHQGDLRLHVCHDVLAHLAGNRVVPEGWRTLPC